MLFGPTTVEMCGCLYPSAGPNNFEIRGAKRANEFELVVTYQKRGKGTFTLLSDEALFEVHLDTSITSDTMEVV
jgi:hypothetical protein